MKWMAGARFSVLFVCHANVCRSAMAERLARNAFAGSWSANEPPVDVSSAGTHASVGAPMHPTAVRVLEERGVDRAGFASRPLTAGIVEHADLILAATRQQRAASVALVPGVARRTFTVRQFGRLLGALDPVAMPAGARLGTLLDELTVARGRLQPVPGNEEDLSDPIRCPVEAFRACAEEIQRTLDLMAGLFSAP